MMTEQSEMRKSLEAILGFELSEEAFELIRLQPVASYTYSDRPGEGFRTLKNPIAQFPPKRCETARLLDISGFSTTGGDGKSVFRLSDFICSTNSEVFLQPINFVATPRSPKPCMLTVLHSTVNNATDVQIQVFAWDANGAPAQTISFDWRCRVVLLTILL